MFGSEFFAPAWLPVSLAHMTGFAGAFCIAFIIASTEALVFTTLLLPGTIMTMGLGLLIAYGRADAAGTLLGVLTGMWVGNQISFWIARTCGRWLRRTKIGGLVLERLGDVGRSPARTLLLSHLCPYLSGLAPAAAGLTTVPFSRFLVFDSMGVVIGTAWFLGVGALFGAGAQEFGQGLVTGVGLVVLAMVISIIVFRGVRSSYRRRGWAFIVSGFFEYPAFLLAGFGYRLLPKCRKAALMMQREEIGRIAQAGDILLVTREGGGPWGKASHAAIFEDSSTVLHAFHSVRREKLADLPLRDGYMLLRVQLTKQQREAVLDFVRQQLGLSFKITTTLEHVRGAVPTHFSCATLVWAAFRTVGIDLAAHIPAARRWVFPRDFTSSPHTMEVPVPPVSTACTLAARNPVNQKILSLQHEQFHADCPTTEPSKNRHEDIPQSLD